MGLFDIFSSNKMKWHSTAGENKDFAPIITNFFINDNIDFEQYLENQKGYNIVKEFGNFNSYIGMSNLSLSSDKKQIFKFSPIFKRRFIDERFDPALGIPDWMYVAYPDVVYWFQDNIENLQNIFNKYENQYGQDLLLFRELINEFKRNNVLECSA